MQDSINAVDLTTVGWILVLAGALVIVLTAVTTNRGPHHALGRDHDPRRRQPDHDRAAAAQRPAAGGLTTILGGGCRTAPASGGVCGAATSFWVRSRLADNLARLPCNGRGSRVPG